MTLSTKAEPGSPAETWKRLAAERALALVRDGMVIGLGSGSTARYFIEGVARLVRDGVRVRAVASSRLTAALAAQAGIPLLDDLDRELDLAVDGADEIDPACNCVKGRGGALLREKIVAQAALRFVLVADDSKLVARLLRGPLPVEILPFLWRQTRRRIETLGGHGELRGGESAPVVTDNGNWILDVQFEEGIDAASLDGRLHAIAGVVEHGLFVGLARSAIVAGSAGIRVLGEPVSEA
ncbi:MAG TPA: ribose-5-phosphate isomerase RpiA [Candidatus Limnocylindrales bacterium]|nr:ribose-5-phosphate isomerase RpiA [Candidatus Limnocylindrales bacterium]